MMDQDDHAVSANRNNVGWLGGSAQLPFLCKAPLFVPSFRRAVPKVILLE